MKTKEDIDIYIVAINFIMSILLFISIFIFACELRNSNYPAAISSLGAIIPIAAAWLVLCIADRKLCIDQAEKEKQIELDKLEKEKQIKLETVKSLHYLMAIGSDLRSQANHLGYMLEKSDYHILPHQLENLANGIEKRYEQILQEKDAYRFLQGITLSKIINLSGSIFGLTSLLRSIATQANTTGKSIREIFEAMNKNSLLKRISSHDLEINSIIEDLYNIRSTI